MPPERGSGAKRGPERWEDRDDGRTGTMGGPGRWEDRDENEEE